MLGEQRGIDIRPSAVGLGKFSNGQIIWNQKKIYAYTQICICRLKMANGSNMHLDRRATCVAVAAQSFLVHKLTKTALTGSFYLPIDFARPNTY